ncbi:glycerate kinase [Mariniblastus sp.]|nr:glycerate kinase [Mariniblastus sp.]
MLKSSSLSEDAREIWNAGVRAVEAGQLVSEFIDITEHSVRLGTETIEFSACRRLIVIGFGKASGAMAVGLEQRLGAAALRKLNAVGRINVPDDRVFDSKFFKISGCRPGAVNLPTDRVLEATDEILELVRTAGPEDVVICLISGGGSALLEKPVDSISLAELRATTEFLSASGASIYQLNAVRRELSQVKGGGLARQCDARMVSLIISDVIGDDLSVIASGPTCFSVDDSTGLEVLLEFDPNRETVPEAVWRVVDCGAPRISAVEGHPQLSNFVIGNIETAMLASRKRAIELGYQVELVSPVGDEGEAGTVGRSVAIEIAQASLGSGSKCLISGGETTVLLPENPGRGGRNQQLVLAAINSLLSFQLSESADYCLLSGGTDGEDGSVSVAGGWVDADWINQHNETRKQELAGQSEKALEACGSFDFLNEHSLIFQVAATNTNVCDLRIALSYSGGT